MAPSKGTPIRPVRVEDALWRDAQAAAKARGLSVSEYLRWALEELVAGRLSGPPSSSPE
jgi:hypothetical protein